MASSKGVLISTKLKLEEINNHQTLLKNGLEKVSTRDEFQSLESRFLTQQSLLSEVNNELLSLKKDIKSTRESQVIMSQQSQDSQNVNPDSSKVLIRRAKELIMQKRFLLQLLNAQKDLKIKISSLSVKFPHTPPSNNDHDLTKKPIESKKESKKKPLSQLINNNLIVPGEKVLTVLLKQQYQVGDDTLNDVGMQGSNKHATLTPTGDIVTSKGKFETLEAWLCSESQIVFSKNASFAMVKYKGRSISSIVDEVKTKGVVVNSQWKKNGDKSKSYSSETSIKPALIQQHPPTIMPKNDDLALSTSQLTVPDASCVLLWGEESLIESSSILPGNFWQVGFESVDLYEKLMRL